MPKIEYTTMPLPNEPTFISEQEKDNYIYDAYLRKYNTHYFSINCSIDYIMGLLDSCYIGDTFNTGV